MPNLSSVELQKYISFADKLAAICRKTGRAAFEEIAPFVTKDDGSPVTAADHAIEEKLVAVIRAAYPHHGILGEETGASNIDKEFVWVIDPIDGTKSFATGTSTFGSLIALCWNNEPIVGLIELPVSGWRYIGAKEHPTTLNGTPVKTRPRAFVSECVLSASGAEFFRGAAPRDGYDRLTAASKWNIHGAGCSGYGSLSRGLIDISIDGANLSTFDYCALVPIVEGAGGRITDWNGESFKLVHELDHRANGVIATGDRKIHETALNILSD